LNSPPKYTINTKLISKNKSIKIYRWDTARSCLEYFFNVKSLNHITKTTVKGYDEQGTKWEVTPKRLLKAIQKQGCWGFVENKNKLHFWCHKNCKNTKQLFALFAHELGHFIKPYYKNTRQEEIKAGTYGTAAEFAFDMIKSLGYQIVKEE
jgi:hypothetical protein